MIDPLLSLAFSMRAGPGTYALLLGSGVSRQAGIPTGWEVVLELLRRLAALEGTGPGPSPEVWYQARHGDSITYSILLERLAPTAAARANILREFFEPTEEQRLRGEKVPTKAHHAIAQLASDGYVRVILTTNFDRLIESALDRAGVRRVVVHSAAGIQGMTPLMHNDCTVIKLHGDYGDLVTRNTADELGGYEPPMAALLERVLDEHGLIICGWSAEHDAALVNAIEASPSRRYGSFWALRSDRTAQQGHLIDLQKAQVIRVSGADEFFTKLQENVTSLARLAAPHPLSAAVAVDTLKRYLPDARFRINLDDLVTEEIERLVAELGPEHFPTVLTEELAPTEYGRRTEERLAKYENVTEICLSLFAAGVWWGRRRHWPLFTRALDRLLNYRQELTGDDLWTRLLLYPALLCLYAAGISAVASGHIEILRSLLKENVWRDSNGRTPASSALRVHNVMRTNTLNCSRRIFRALRPAFHALLPDDHKYEEAFERFEYLLALVQADAGSQGDSFGVFDLGLWALKLYRSVEYDSSQVPSRVFEKELSEQEGSWSPIRAGLFSSPSRAREVMKHVDESVMTQGVPPW
jgi:hypothetical protein